MNTTESMKAARLHRYGPPSVVNLDDVPVPQPGENEVLVKVEAASVNPLDWHRMRGKPYLMRLGEGLRAPKQPMLGTDVAGTVVELGDGVVNLAAGDQVFGSGVGSFAEYMVVAANGLAHMPQGLSFTEAASLPVASYTALQALRDVGRLSTGDRLLVVGAGGGVGSLAVQLGRALGATVTAVCSASKVDIVRGLGADVVIDYRKEDFTKSRERYDLVLDLARDRSLRELRRTLKPGGTVILAGAPKGDWFRPVVGLVTAPAWSAVTDGTFKSFLSKRSQADLLAIRDMVEAEEVKPVIDRVYMLDEVRQAISYLEEGHATGKVMIEIA